MERCFNTTGPCFPEEHYMLPPERRLGEVLDLIARNKYFVLHAGRQTGKTTSLMWLETYLPTIGKRAVRLDLQTARDNPDPRSAFLTAFNHLARSLMDPTDGLRAAEPAQVAAWLEDPHSAVQNYFQFLTAQDPRPLVILVDEADALAGETMVSFLTQLRDGYIGRKKAPFPASVVLVGIRAIRDYVVRKEDQRVVSWLGTSSPFNVSAESTMLEPFTEPEIAELVGQHTMETGQRFDPAAAAKIWQLAEGHPWLTNALADQAVRKEARDRSAPVTAAHVEAAKEAIILERRTHIDSLIARLHEPRVARILSLMLVGERTGKDVLEDDLAYVIGLGLLRLKDRRYEIANAIYREVIPRALTFSQQAQLEEQTAWYVLPDGRLDMPKLFKEWQKFWRKDGHLAAAAFNYREAGPHLMLMAFLQRIVNGGGQVEREYGLGRGALDLMIEWQGQKHAIEVKLRRDTETEEDALEQVTRYLDHAGLEEGWLVMFDLRKEIPWKDKLMVRELEHEGRAIHLVGC